MAPKRKQTTTNFEKKLSKVEIEKKICKRRLDSLEQEESLIKDDRFILDERKKLIDAYNEHGFNIFQNPSKLLEYLPNRRESDIKGLIQRLQVSLQAQEGGSNEEIHNQKWQKLCDKMMANFSKDKKINMDQVFADVLKLEAEELEDHDQDLRIPNDDQNQLEADDVSKPNYAQLINSFSQLITGVFPDRMSPTNARLSMHLFQHVNEVAESIYSKCNFDSLRNGSWLEDSVTVRRKRHEMALKGLEAIDGVIKKYPTFRDIESNPNIEALCLELPKIRRVTDVLNPLQTNDLNQIYEEFIFGSFSYQSQSSEIANLS